MNSLALLASVLLSVTALSVEKDGVAQPSAQPSATPLFNGKSFEGWEGNLDAFRIEDGAIVGGSMKTPVPRNEYLCTKKEYVDFELRLKFKVLGKDPNAGIQIRSERVADSNEMVGYQADIGQVYWGCLYDERRHKLLTGPPVKKQGKLYKKDDWNEYVIRCQGQRIQLWLNGRRTVDYSEPDRTIPQKGVIGLQIHGGPPSEAWYKDITIRALPAARSIKGSGYFISRLNSVTLRPWLEEREHRLLKQAPPVQMAARRKGAIR